MRQVMLTRAVLAGFLGLAVAATPVMAQSSGASTAQKAADPSGSYARKKNICYREGGLRKDLSGDALTRFMATCMSEVTMTKPPANPEAAWRERCKTEGESQRRLTGDQLATFVKSCMGQ